MLGPQPRCQAKNENGTEQKYVLAFEKKLIAFLSKIK